MEGYTSQSYCTVVEIGHVRFPADGNNRNKHSQVRRVTHTRSNRDPAPYTHIFPYPSESRAPLVQHSFNSFRIHFTHITLNSVTPMAHRPLTRTYAVANLEEMVPVLPATVKRANHKRTRNAESTESDGTDGNDGEPPSQEPPESPVTRKRGQPSAKNKPAAPRKSAKTTKGNASKPTPEAASGNSKAVPPRDPLPPRTNRNNHPGIIDLPRSKRTPAEVVAATKRKATLQRQVEDLERRRIEMLAEMELQEELQEEEEEHAVVKRLAASSSLDNMEDVNIQSEDGGNSDATSIHADSESGSEGGDATKGKKAQKGKGVRILYFLQDVFTLTN